MAREAGDTDFTNVNVVTCIKVGGTKVLGTQQASIAKIAAELASTNNLVNVVNSILDVLDAHGLTA